VLALSGHGTKGERGAAKGEKKEKEDGQPRLRWALDRSCVEKKRKKEEVPFQEGEKPRADQGFPCRPKGKKRKHANFPSWRGKGKDRTRSVDSGKNRGVIQTFPKKRKTSLKKAIFP